MVGFEINSGGRAEEKPHDNRLDMKYERKNSQGWLMSLRCKQLSRWLMPSSE